MDPLSVSASIIAVLQATNSVISLCYNYRAAAQDSSWELPRVIELIKSLRNVLETLEGLASGIKGTDSDADSRLQTLQQLCSPKAGNEGGLLAMCLEELNSLQKKLTPPGWAGPIGSKRMALVQALKWPLKESDTKKTLESIGRFRDTLNLALMTDQMALVLKIDEVAQAIQDNTLGMLGELTELNESFHNARIDEHREKIHQWLAAPDPSSNHVDALGKRRATTGLWFIGSIKFEDWKKSPNSFLWLSGIPGCGKTVLTSVVIEAVLEHCRLSVGTAPNPPPTCAVVYFYFDFSQGQKRNYEKMIRSLITQLSQQLHYTSEPLELLFSTCTNGNRQPTIEALRNCMREMTEEFSQVFVIIDALDECEDREDLIDNINEFKGWDLQALHILATSRMEGDIEDGLDVPNEQKLHIQSDLIQEDIRAYIYARLQMDKKLRRWQKDKKDQETIVGTLMEKSDGMFRWAACQLDALKKCLSRRELQKALASLPKTLDETYEQILCSIDEERCEMVLTILQWLAYSARPLKIEEIADVIAVNTKSKPRFDPESRFPEPRDILTICSSLVSSSSSTTEVSYDEKVGEQIRLAHLSVRDYLVSERILTGKAARYNVQEARAQESISQICLAYLLQFDKPDSLPKRDMGIFPLARYAAEFWTHHVRASGKETDDTVQLSMELFSNQDAFTNWIRLFDPDKASPSPVMANDLERVAAPLYYASQAGLNGAVKRLLELGADVNAVGGVYGNALQVASGRGFDDTVKLLLHGGAEVDAQGGIYGSALQAASFGGYSKVVQVLLDMKANVNGRGGIYEGALQAASAGGHVEVVSQLINAGADINTFGGAYSSALHAASYGGHDSVVEHLLNAGADIELPDKDGRTPLYQASSEGHSTTIRLLLARGANVNAEDKDGWAALDEAGPAGYVEAVQALLDAGADVNAPDHWGTTALHFIASQGHTDLVQLLLRYGAYVNYEDMNGETPLYNAASAGRHETVRALLESDARVNTADLRGWSALHAAVVIGHEPTARVLLENGARISPDEDGWTPLHVAVLKGNEAMVRLLLDRGANITAEDSEGKTAFEWASLAGHGLRSLERRIQSKAKTDFAFTGLRAAAYAGDDVRIQQLLENGADINAEDGGGWTALLWAVSEGHHSTTSLLIANGADVNARTQNGETVMDLVEMRDDATLMHLIGKKFNVQAREDERQLALKRRENVSRLLESYKTECVR